MTLQQIDLDNAIRFSLRDDSGRRYACSCALDDASIERETEKAVLLKFKTSYGIVTFWCPKSVCDTENEAYKINAARRAKANETRENAYNDLVSWAKECGLKVRVGFKAETIRKKLIAGGFPISRPAAC